jgi:hypothetical protein
VWLSEEMLGFVVASLFFFNFSFASSLITLQNNLNVNLRIVATDTDTGKVRVLMPNFTTVDHKVYSDPWPEGQFAFFESSQVAYVIAKDLNGPNCHLLEFDLGRNTQTVLPPSPCAFRMVGHESSKTLLGWVAQSLSSYVLVSVDPLAGTSKVLLNVSFPGNPFFVGIYAPLCDSTLSMCYSVAFLEQSGSVVQHLVKLDFESFKLFTDSFCFHDTYCGYDVGHKDRRLVCHSS